MEKVAVKEKINRTVKEMQDLVNISKRKILELEILLASEEIKNGEFDVFESVKDLMGKN